MIDNFLGEATGFNVAEVFRPPLNIDGRQKPSDTYNDLKIQSE